MAKGTRPPPEWVRLVRKEAFQALPMTAQAVFSQLVALTHTPPPGVPYGHLASPEGKRMGATALAGQMAEDAPAISRALQALFAAGLVAKDADGRIYLPGMERLEQIRLKRAAGGAAGAAHGVKGKDFGHLGKEHGVRGPSERADDGGALGYRGGQFGVAGSQFGVRGGRPCRKDRQTETPRPPPSITPPVPPLPNVDQLIDNAEKITPRPPPSENPPSPPFQKPPVPPLPSNRQGEKHVQIQSNGVHVASRLDAAASGELEDPVLLMFEQGLNALVRVGVTQANARSLIGKLRKRYPDEEALGIVLKCVNKTDPVAFLMRSAHGPADNDKPKKGGNKFEGQPVTRKL